MQDIKSKMSVYRPDHKSATTSLMESAATMLKNGETADVVTFVTETLKEVRDSVVPAILDASNISQKGLFTTHSHFFVVQSELWKGLEDIKGHEKNEKDKSDQHKKCRKEEADACTKRQSCDKELYDKWLDWFGKETDLSTDHGAFETYFCNNNGTEMSVRKTSKDHMVEWNTTHTSVVLAESAYTKKMKECKDYHDTLDAKTTSCNNRQGHLEKWSCSYAKTVGTVMSDFHSSWKDAVSTYDNEVNRTKHMQADRISEYKTLEVVQCLLGRVKERNGVPCDSATEEYQGEVSTCQNKSFMVDISALELMYPCVPPLPAMCKGRDLTKCLPVVQPYPCGDDFKAQEYAKLPALDVAPFGVDGLTKPQEPQGPRPDQPWRNTACNDRQTCDVCFKQTGDLTRVCAMTQTSDTEAKSGACWSKEISEESYCASNPYASGCITTQQVTDDFPNAGKCPEICEGSHMTTDSKAYMEHLKSSDITETNQTVIEELFMEWCDFDLNPVPVDPVPVDPVPVDPVPVDPVPLDLAQVEVPDEGQE